MLQPVGGMDAIPKALARALGSAIRYRAEVVEMRRVGPGARVTWRDGRNGTVHALDADFVICTIPLPVLRRVESDFPPALQRAIAVGADAYVPAVKVAFQSSRRWWETDYQIYGGISWTSRDITQIWYPSAGLNGDRGILLGAYIWTTAIGRRFAAMPPAERHAAAVADGERLHPGYAKLVDRGVSIAWSKVPFSGGGWVDWGNGAWRAAYPALLNGHGPVHFAHGETPAAGIVNHFFDARQSGKDRLIDGSFRPDRELDDVFGAERGDQLARRPERDDLAVIDHGHAIAQARRLFHVMGREQHGPAPGLEALDDLPRLPA